MNQMIIKNCCMKVREKKRELFQSPIFFFGEKKITKHT